MRLGFESRAMRWVLPFVIAALALLALAASADAAFPGANGKIAFASNRDGNSEIYSMNADGSSQTRLTNNDHPDGHPVWSPDGTKLLFGRTTSNIFSAITSLYVMNAEGTGEQFVTGSQISGWTWRPDGQKLAFTAGVSCGHGFCFENDAFTIDVDGTNGASLGRTPDRSEVSLDWSPGGSKIAISGGLLGTDGSAIWTINSDGSGLTPLVIGPSNDSDPSWSPDGKKIAFVSDRDGNSEIYVMNADGSGQTRLTDDPAIDGRPAWSPDGSKIAFARAICTDSGCSGDLYTMNADGTEQTNLTNNTPGSNLLDSAPSWQPIPGPKRSDYKNSNQFCKAEQAFWGGQFGQHYRNFGQCVSGR
jgi:Tol biopolymer transport system component